MSRLLLVESFGLKYRLICTKVWDAWGGSEGAVYHTDRLNIQHYTLDTTLWEHSFSTTYFTLKVENTHFK